MVQIKDFSIQRSSTEKSLVQMYLTLAEAMRQPKMPQAVHVYTE